MSDTEAYEEELFEIRAMMHECMLRLANVKVPKHHDQTYVDARKVIGDIDKASDRVKGLIIMLRCERGTNEPMRHFRAPHYVVGDRVWFRLYGNVPYRVAEVRWVKGSWLYRLDECRGNIPEGHLSPCYEG